MNNIIGTKDAAKILGVTPVQVWRLADKGTLPHEFKLGKQFMFDPEKVRQFADARKQKNAQQAEAVA